MPKSLSSNLAAPLKRMAPPRPEKILADTLSSAGIAVNGSKPWDVEIHDWRVAWRYLLEGSMGFGDAYVEGLWDCRALDQFSARVFSSSLTERGLSWPSFWQDVKSLFFNLQSLRRAPQVAKRHYDLGNDLYSAMLDRRMIYSCGYWQDAETLDEAQEAKLDLICRKLRLEPGMTVVDIGCGWGGWLKFAAEKYGVAGVGLTLSRRQAETARQACRGLPVEIRLQDYRELDGRFDRIVSVGMFEHVGVKNYPEFMRVCHRGLQDDGLFLLHTIGGNASVTHTDPWLERYIFPNGMIPSVAQIGRSAEKLFIMEDWHNFGVDYDKTLMAWHANFTARWPELREKYGAAFYRLWSFYLLMCAGSFRARYNQVWQVVLSKNPRGGYPRAA